MPAVNDPAERAEGDGRSVQEGAKAVGETAAEGGAHQARVPHRLQTGEDGAEPGEERQR